MKFAFCLLLLCLVAFGQTQPRPAFDVASIKPNTTGGGSQHFGTEPGRVDATNVSVKAMIELAFELEGFRITGGPPWLDTQTYDILAKTGQPDRVSIPTLRLLFQSLLEDRFALKFHRETRQSTVYSMAAVKGGAKLTPSAPETRTTNNTNLNKTSNTIIATHSTMDSFAEMLGHQLGRTVIDNTGLKGNFDYKVTWVPDEVPNSSGPSLFTAIQEQLGLKLESAKGPVEFLVVDSVQKASDN